MEDRHLNKYDKDKIDIDLVFKGFNNSLVEVSKLGTFGAKKYSRKGFLEVSDGFDRYSSAMLRHYFLEDSEVVDSETGLSHETAVAWNALARLEFKIRSGL